MKNLIQLKSTFLSLFVSIFLGACTVQNADNEITMPETLKENSSTSSLADTEMDFNYYILSVFYLNANDQLGSIQKYIGQGEKNGYSSNNYEYPDIYYMYNQMGDNYTMYIGPYYAQRYDLDATTDEIYNLGVQVKEVPKPCDSLESCDPNSKIVIEQVFKEGPAEKAGLKVGDTILYVESTIPGNLEAFEKITSGAEGDTISLKIARKDTTLDINVSLFCYLEPTVFLSYQDSIPIIKISAFEEQSGMPCSKVTTKNFVQGTAFEFKNALKETSGATVIDLRGNPGGSLSQCYEAASMVLSKGDTLLIETSTDIAEDSIHQLILTDKLTAEENGIGNGRYYVLMADTNSASCAEVMLMAITSNLQSPIVGKITYGKAIGQYYIQTPADGYGIITALKLNDKNGDSYHDVGIEPDYDISDPAKALNKAVELAKEGTEKRTHGYGNKPLNHFTGNFAKKGFSNKKTPKGGAYKWIQIHK